MTRDRLIGMLWAETDEERARKGLNQALYALRQEMGADEVFLGTQDVRLNPDLVTSDVAAFSAALKAGQPERAAGGYAAPSSTDFTSRTRPSSSAGSRSSGRTWRGTTAPRSSAWPGGRPTGGPPGRVEWWRRLARRIRSTRASPSA